MEMAKEEDLLLLGRRHVCVERLLLLLLLRAAHGRHDGEVGWRRALPSWWYWPGGAAVQSGTSTPHLGGDGGVALGCVSVCVCR